VRTVIRGFLRVANIAAMRRFIPRFAIRDLVWLTLAVGLSLGWYLERRRMIDQFDDRLVGNVFVVAHDGATSTGSVVESKTPLMQIKCSPDGTGTIQSNDIEWRLGQQR